MKVTIEVPLESGSTLLVQADEQASEDVKQPGPPADGEQWCPPMYEPPPCIVTLRVSTRDEALVVDAYELAEALRRCMPGDALAYPRGLVQRARRRAPKSST